MHHTDKYSTAQSFGQFYEIVECSFTNKVVVGSNPVPVTKISDIAPVSSKEFLDIQTTRECRFSLKRVCDMIRTHN